MISKHTGILLSTALLAASCASQRHHLRAGDLAFIAASDGEYSQAIAASTGAGSAVAYDHVGIVATDAAGRTVVVEALPQGGVQATPWEAFAARAPRLDTGRGLLVMRVPQCNGDSTAVRALRLCGLPYDWEFAPGNGMYYCSELVQDCCLDSQGQPVFPSEPMNFLAPDGSMPQFWSEHFASLGLDVPQGAPGTNPTSMSAVPGLQQVLP